MNILADLHHQSLYHSLHLLFEKRLGYKLYRPIGTEWHSEGYWKVYDHPHTVAQFLGLHQGTDMPMDVHGIPLPESERKNLHYTIEDGIYYVRDLVHKTTHRAITLDKFKNIKFDIILSSIPQHIQPFEKLKKLYQPQAKTIFQIGNAWGHQQAVKNIMASTAPFPHPINSNVIFYHQEFDLDIFKYEPPEFHNVVHSYVHYMKNPYIMDQYKKYLPGWQFQRFGAGMEQNILEVRGVADAMRRSAFTWQYKPEGDGYGYSAHCSYACGRPLLVWGSHYRGKLLESVLEDGTTCIDMEKESIEDNVKKLQHYSQPEEHERMCEAAYQRFKQVVNFDEEFLKIKKFLGKLI